MKIAYVQMNILYGEPQQNFTKVEKYMNEAANSQNQRKDLYQ
jgi:predicted amidohydrolase